MVLIVPSLVVFVLAPMLGAVPDDIPGKGIQRMDRLALKLREETRDLWNHGYHGYMAFAYPLDELKPITCKGQGRDIENPGNYARNDVNGNYSLTHLDLLSSLALFKGEQAFRKGVDRALRDTNFNQDVKVQVFEATIRILGSLLSSYQQLLEFDRASVVRASGSAASSRFRHLFPHQSRRNETTPPSSSNNFLTGIVSRFFPSIISSSSVPSQSTWNHIPTTTSPEESPKQERPQEVSAAAKALLNLAVDLADRLMPAFATPFGLPYARVNLKYGVVTDETQETCTAGAGSLVLEFTLLSRLTGNPKYENAARKAFFALWKRRSPIDLMGNAIGVQHGLWLSPGTSTIGAGVDSFLEYALKAAVMLDDDTYMDAWHDAYAAVMQHLRTNDGYILRGVHLRTGAPTGSMIDSLSAFWPGLQVLAGDVEGAIKSHLVYWWLWRKYKAMPEGFNYVNKTVEWAGYPLRPEFIESTYHLYRATRDPFYLKVGQRILQDLRRRTRTRCGFAVIHDVSNGKLEDRMESFLLSEVFKYLFLLFDVDNPINHRLSGTVFTTEGHIISLPRRKIPKSQTRTKLRLDIDKIAENLICPAYRPADMGGLLVGIQGREDYDYTATVVDMPLLTDDGYWDEDGFCELPEGGQHHFDIVFKQGTPSPSGEMIYDHSPHRSKVQRDPASGDIIVWDAENIQAKVTRRMDGSGFDVTSVANHRIRSGQSVWVRDPSVVGQYPSISPRPKPPQVDPAEVRVRLARLTVQPGQPGGGVQLNPVRNILAATGTFGRPLTHPEEEGVAKMDWGFQQSYLPLVPASARHKGCHDTSYPDLKGTGHSPFIALAERGTCSFYKKAMIAAKAGARGLMIVGVDDEGLIRPSADNENQELVDDIGIVYIKKADGFDLFSRLKSGELIVMQVEEKDGKAGRMRTLKNKGGGGGRGGEVDQDYLSDLVIEGMPIKNLRLELDVT